MCKKFTFKFVFCLFLITNFCRAQILINEYSASNLSTYADNFGKFGDWIELYNTLGVPVNLSGYHLSDKAINLGKWTFGNVMIPANGVLRIWASSKNVNAGANLHAGFSLNQCQSDKIILSNPGFFVLDSLTLKKTQINHSRGRKTDGAPTWSVFTTPTPNASNNTSTPYNGYATTPVMSLAQGFYPGPQSLTITSPDPGVTIRYTTNGFEPDASSGIVYFTAIPITTTQVVRAEAVSSNPNILVSFVESNTFFISVTHSVNVVSVFGDGALVLLGGTQINTEVGLEYFDNFGLFKADGFGLSNEHGNDSWFYSQRGIDFVCHDEYGYNDALNYKIFNTKTRASFQRIILKAAANDNYPAAGLPNTNFPGELGGAHIRDQYVNTVAQKANMHLDERTWAPAVMYVNGQYWGVYDVREKVDDKDFCKYYHKAHEDSLQFLQTWGGTWSAYGGAQAQTDWTALKNFIVSNSMTVAANYAYADSMLSTKSLADYAILNSYVVCSDWLNWNTAWWRGRNATCNKKKWRYTLWDEDATFKHYINYTGLPNININANPCDPQTLNNPGGQGHVPILNALLTNPIFKQYYVMRYFDLINGGLSCARMVNIFDSMILQITPEMPKHITRWGGTMAQWQTNCTAMRNFIQARCDTVTKLFNGCYNVTGPFKIKVNVDPPGSGTVDFNTLNLTTFLWTGTYPGNLPNILKAHPKVNYCFSHWTTKTHTLSPNFNDSIVSINLSAGDSVVAHFIYNPKPIVTPAYKPLCFGDTVQLNATNGLNYTWIPSIGLSCTTCSNPIANPTVSTIYTVTSVASLSLACKESSTQTISINPKPVAAPINTLICLGYSVQLSASNGANYNWTPTVGLSCATCSNPIASPTVSTTYSVSTIISGSLSCKANASQTIVVNPYATALFTVVSTQSILPQSIPVINSSSLATSYYWYCSNGNSFTTASPNFIITAPGSYSIMLIAYGNGGCNDTTAKYFVVSDTSKIYTPVVTMPNIFTPNGDGVNDSYFPIMRYIKESNCLIFDRWGNLVFELRGINETWNGDNNKGRPSDPGTYFYIMTGKDIYDKDYTYKGFFQLMR